MYARGQACADITHNAWAILHHNCQWVWSCIIESVLVLTCEAYTARSYASTVNTAVDSMVWQCSTVHDVITLQ